MIERLLTAAAVVLLAAAAPAAPATAAPVAAPVAAAPACVTVTIDGLRGVYRPDSQFWEPWFDATVKGRSTPCGSGGDATLAITQYHVRGGVPTGLMSTPWRAAGPGGTAFSRTGRIAPDVAALCVSTGQAPHGAGRVAVNAACVRPVRSGADHLVTRFAAVPLTDPLVTADLSEYPPEDATPTGPVCAVDCLASTWTTGPPGPPGTTWDTPISGPTIPLLPEEPTCHTVSITDSFAGPSDDNVNGFDIWMAGAVDSCDPNGTEPTIHAVRYWSDRGIVMPAWDLAQVPLAKGAQVNENTGALCLTSGIRQRGGRLYGVHDRCWRIVRDQPDRYRLAPIRTDEARVRKPLVSNVPLPDPDYPPGVCASCL
ncbi:hypothetical protein GCM10020358_81120 [Amorphoplanes nipponensis]|uniref:Secreted protein n=1 Tax=Actinoplanes nipponensis TaxID=135950 RepID=A0A919JE44_9ACTN|nr:hypothetical protein [Actinoplanes nipponensis]GIE47695.1 hypothetical protein Ani05nite_12290 [Actinoplanes nipponensis]